MGVQRSVIRVFRIGAPIAREDLLFFKEPVRGEKVKIDEIRIPREGRHRLVGRVAVAGGPEGQYLPVFLSRGGQEVRERVRFFPERSDPVGGRKRGNVH